MSVQGSSVHSLARQMALHTAAVAFVLAAIISLYAVSNRIHSLQNDHIGIRDGLIAATLPAFNLATFNYNSRLNQHLAEGLARHPQIASVVVLDTDGSIQARASAESSCSPAQLDLLLFGEPAIEVTQLTYAGTHLGKLVVEDDICGLVRTFYSSLWSTIAYVLLITAAVAGFVFATFYRRITRPLTRLSHQISSLSADTIEQADLSSFHSSRRDELGQLVRGTRGLLEMLKDHIARQHRAEDTISQYSAKLETLIHKRSDALAGIRRKLSSNTDDERQSQVPLLSVVLPQASELLRRISTQLSRTDQEETLRLLALMEKLSIIEQPERTSVVTISDLLHASLSQCPSPVSMRQEVTDQILVPAGRFSLLLDNLACIAAHSTAAEHTQMTLRRHNELLEIILTGQGFTLPCATLNTVIDAGFRLAPGTLAAVVRAMTGKLDIENTDNGNARVTVQIPVQWLSDKLGMIREHLRHTPIFLSFENELLQHQIQRWLEEWDITWTLNSRELSASLTLTDSTAKAHNNGPCVILQTPVPERAYQQADLLKDLLQLIPGNKPQQRATQVLLVDDNTINRMLCQRFLRNLGITPDTVDNGLQALEQAQRKRYDLILMDCQMPVMDGLESTRQIRRHSLNMKTPIIALTGLTGENERQHCLTAGMNDFIGKPFTQDQIQAVLIQWLDSFPVNGPLSSSAE